MTLATLWFVLIAVLWIGFFVLEGFDLGVGALHMVVGRNEADRRTAISAIGPFWDGNEVWLVVAAAAMFAAFPGWYATMFSGFYLLMVLILAGLILRGVSFEFRDKVGSPKWRLTWDISMTVGSIIVPAGLGIALADLLHGVPVGSNQEYTGSFWDLFHPYALFAGLTVLLLCLVHGSTFLALKTEGGARSRARRLAAWLAPVTGLAVLGLIAWTRSSEGSGVLVNPVEAIAVIAIFAAAWLAGEGYEGWAFTATTVAIAATVGGFFIHLYPDVMVSSTNPAYSLTVQGTASGSYTLKLLTIIAIIFLPLIIAYQGWSYHVFYQRVKPQPVAPVETPNPASVPQP
jgi:cytochrome d ubiquinol oxidase subunit II